MRTHTASAGLTTVTGQFDRYQGTLNLSGRPAVSLVIEGDSLDTGTPTKLIVRGRLVRTA